MSTAGVHAKAAPVTSQFQFGPWTVATVGSHILESEGPARHRFEGQLELPQVPEMIFADNVLRVQHMAGYGIEFNALDALKLVDAHHDHLKVAMAQAWKEARTDCEHINEVVKPFDWTFTTGYKGTLLGSDSTQMQVIPTEERIDMEKLKLREKIHFYEDILLFEDELSDNGSSVMNVKIRVMPTSFFILLRQFLRVDNVIVRVLDTRLHHEFLRVDNVKVCVLDTRLHHEAGEAYILREHSCRDSATEDIKAPAHVVTSPNEVAQLLPVRTETFEKLVFPECSTAQIERNDGIR